MTYETIQRTIYKLLNIRELYRTPENWGQNDNPDERAVPLDQAFALVGIDSHPYQRNLGADQIYSGDLDRGKIPEPVWFVCQAMNEIAPEFEGLIHKWNDALGRTHEEVLDLVMAAINLAKEERAQIWASDISFDTPDIPLHRWASRDGRQLCAMSALSQKLGCSIVSDMPPEVDPGLAALVNLLNDRATDKARQLLASRLNHIPYSGRTNITSLMTRAYFPIMMMRYGFKREISGLDDCTSREQFAAIYDYLSERFQEPDGSGFFAAGCATLTAALKADDPAKQDLMALAAASQLVSFEMGLGWVELLQILDYIVGIEDVPYADHDVTFAKYGKYFLEAEAPAETDNANRPFEKVYDFGIKVLWFPALVEKFSDRLEEIAGQILDEVADLESVELYMHRFSFEDEEVMIATSWDEELNILSADADLVAYQDVFGEIDLDGDGDASPLLVPVPASAAETIH